MQGDRSWPRKLMLLFDMRKRAGNPSANLVASIHVPPHKKVNEWKKIRTVVRKDFPLALEGKETLTVSDMSVGKCLWGGRTM